MVGSLRVTYIADVPDIRPLVERFRMEPAIDAFGRSALCTTSRFMVEHPFAGGKGMLRLMAAAYRDAAARQVRLVYGDCSAEMLPFYRHLGYRTYAPPFVDPSYGLRVPLLMVGRDGHWFSQARSPLARVAVSFAEDVEAREWFDRTWSKPPSPQTDVAAF